jgi:hypothetical protein
LSIGNIKDQTEMMSMGWWSKLWGRKAWNGDDTEDDSLEPRKEKGLNVQMENRHLIFFTRDWVAT